MSTTGITLLRAHRGVVLASLGGVAALLGLALLMSEAGVHTAGAQGPIYAARGQMLAFNIHVLSGLTLALTLVTQVSVHMRKRLPRAWIAGAVATWALLVVSIHTGLLLSVTNPSIHTRLGLYWSVGLLGIIWVFLTWYFIRGDWFHYRLWVARASVGLILQVPFRFFLAGIFGLTGDQDLAGSMGYWSALVFSVLLVEWVLLPLVWRPKRNVERLSFQPGATIIRQGEVGTALYVVETGTVEVLKESADGSQTRLAALGPGEWFGEIALVRDEPCNATVRAMEPVLITRVDREGFENLFGAILPLRDAFTRTMVERGAQEKAQRTELRTHPTRAPSATR